VSRCRDRRVLFSIAGPSTVRWVPALNVKREHLDEALAVLDEVLGAT
jgi:acetylornithine/succinyldiaminopimelate/putrescine aminotransferase